VLFVSRLQGTLTSEARSIMQCINNYTFWMQMLLGVIDEPLF